MCVTVMTGKQIRIKRIEHDLSLGAFAEKMHVSKTWLSLVETGKEGGLPLRTRATLYFLQSEYVDGIPSSPAIQYSAGVH